MRALDDLVRAGYVRYVGCSNLMAWQIMKALGLSAAKGWARFETVQAYYSIAGRDIEREIVPLMAEEELGLMVWSPLAGGLLSGKFRRDFAGPNDARRTRFDFPPVEREHAYNVVDAILPIAERHGVSVARVALAWLLHQKSVMSVIVGAKTPEQLADTSGRPNCSSAKTISHTWRRQARWRPNIRAGWSIGKTVRVCRSPSQRLGSWQLCLRGHYARICSQTVFCSV